MKKGPLLLVVDELRAPVSRQTRELRGVHCATDRVRERGQGVATVVIFLLVPQMKLSMRLDVVQAAERWSAQLPGPLARGNDKKTLRNCLALPTRSRSSSQCRKAVEAVHTRPIEGIRATGVRLAA